MALNAQTAMGVEGKRIFIKEDRNVATIALESVIILTKSKKSLKIVFNKYFETLQSSLGTIIT